MIRLSSILLFLVLFMQGLEPLSHAAKREKHTAAHTLTCRHESSECGQYNSSQRFESFFRYLWSKCVAWKEHPWICCAAFSLLVVIGLKICFICKPANKGESQEAPKQNDVVYDQGDHPKRPNGLFEEHLYKDIYRKIFPYLDLEDHNTLPVVSKHMQSIIIGDKNRPGLGRVTIKNKDIDETSLEKYENVEGITLLGLVKITNISFLKNVRKICLSRLPNVSNIDISEGLTKELEINGLNACQEIHLPPSLDQLSLENLPNLSRISWLGEEPKYLRKLSLNWCKALHDLSFLAKAKIDEIFLGELLIESIPNIKSVKKMSLIFLDELENIDGLADMLELEDLTLNGLAKIKKLAKLSEKIKHLTIWDLENLEDIDGLAGMHELETLTLKYLPKIKKLTNLRGKIKHFTIEGLDNLKSLSGLEEVNVESLSLAFRRESRINLSFLKSLKGLEKLVIEDY